MQLSHKLIGLEDSKKSFKKFKNSKKKLSKQTVTYNETFRKSTLEKNSLI